MRDSILIVGTGALATFFAARLSAAGVEVTLLGSWPEGLDTLRREGARLEGVGAFPVRATDDPAECRGAKTALVLVKSWQTGRAARQLADCLAEDGLAVTLQNGLGNERVLSEVLGPARVGRGITTLGATLLAPGLVRLGGEGVVTLEANDRLDPLRSILRIAEIDSKVIPDIEPAVWGKLVVNSAINPLTALLQVRNGELLGNPPARQLMGELARETAAVAGSLGVRLPFDGPEEAVERVAQQTADNLSSMLQDVLRGSPTEVDAINGAVVSLGKGRNVRTPVNQVMWALVKAIPVDGKL